MRDLIDILIMEINETNQLHEAYGKFAIEFEQLCLSIRTCITFILYQNGLTDQDFARILLADQTAFPLIQKLKAFITTKYKDTPEVVDHLKPLFKFCLEINEERNNIIHGVWFIGWGEEEQESFDVAKGMKDKITKKGVELRAFNYKSVQFEDFTKKIIISKNLFYRLNGCIIGNENIIENIKQEELDKLN